MFYSITLIIVHPFHTTKRCVINQAVQSLPTQNLLLKGNINTSCFFFLNLRVHSFPCTLHFQQSDIRSDSFWVIRYFSYSNDTDLPIKFVINVLLNFFTEQKSQFWQMKCWQHPLNIQFNLKKDKSLKGNGKHWSWKI